MKTKSARISRHHRLREAYRRELGELGHPDRGHTLEGPATRTQTSGLAVDLQAGWQKPARCMCPGDLAPEVQQWAKEFKRLKRLVRKITRQNLAIIRRHVAVRRAGSRARRPITKRTDDNCSR